MTRSKFLKTLPLIAAALLVPLTLLTAKKPESTAELGILREDGLHHFVKTIDSNGDVTRYYNGKIVSYRAWDRMLYADEIAQLYGGIN